MLSGQTHEKLNSINKLLRLPEAIEKNIPKILVHLKNIFYAFAL